MYIKEGFIKEEAIKNEEIKIDEWGMHGDVIIKRIKELPESFNNLEKEPYNCLAYGEATGHAHKLFDGEFDLRVDSNEPSKRYLKVVTTVALRHQEHKEIIIRPGNYEIGIQREYDPFIKRIREVAD